MRRPRQAAAAGRPSQAHPDAPAPGFSRYNFLAFLSDTVSYFGAIALLSPFTILPLFANRLTDSEGVVALIPTLNMLGLSLPQILGAYLVAGRARYRPFVVRWILVERGAVLLAVISLAALGGAPSMLLLWAPLGFLFIYWFAMGVNGPAYTAMLANAIPTERRGLLYGLGAAVGGLAGFAFARLAGLLLEALPFPHGFTACAAIALALLVVGVTPLAFVREPAGAPAAPVSAPDGVLPVLRADRRFRLYLVSQAIFGLQALPMGIWTSHALRRFDAQDADIAQMTAVIAIAGGATVLGAGWLADRRGNRAVMLASTLLAAAAAVAAWAAPTLPLYIATFIPASTALSGWQLANFNILMEFAAPGRVPAYSAANALLSGPTRFVAPWLGGLLGARLGHHGPVFLLSAAAALAATVLLLFVSDPRRSGAASPIAAA